jgi:hypothetical protein
MKSQRPALLPRWGPEHLNRTRSRKNIVILRLLRGNLLLLVLGPLITTCLHDSRLLNNAIPPCLHFIRANSVI